MIGVIWNSGRRVVRLAVLTICLATTMPNTGYAANVACSTLPAPIYGTGGSANKPMLAKVAAKMAALNPPQTFIFTAPGGCTGTTQLFGSTPLTGTASYWDTAGKETLCDLPLASNVDGGLGI